jgi:HlyD family secretion protein
MQDRRAEIREVQLLRRSGRLAAIASGLTAGEIVIVYPSADHAESSSLIS